MPTGDSQEGASLLGEKRVVPFLAEGKAKTTVLEQGAPVPTRVLRTKQWRPLQILHSMDSRLWSFMAVGVWVAADFGPCRLQQVRGPMVRTRADGHRYSIYKWLIRCLFCSI